MANKFVGDGLLAVFGAPGRLPDHADRAVAAALDVVRRVEAEFDLRIGVGVNSGPVVSGTIGGGGRVEFTVIGDAVNEAARLSELAKKDPGRPLSSGRAVEAASKSEASQWHHQDSTVLRGRSEATEVYATQSSSD